MGESVTEKIARFVTGANFEDIPQSVTDQSKLAVLDWFAAHVAALAVAMEQVSPLLEGKSNLKKGGYDEDRARLIGRKGSSGRRILGCTYAEGAGKF